MPHLENSFAINILLILFLNFVFIYIENLWINLSFEKDLVTNINIKIKFIDTTQILSLTDKHMR